MGQIFPKSLDSGLSSTEFKSEVQELPKLEIDKSKLDLQTKTDEENKVSKVEVGTKEIEIQDENIEELQQTEETNENKIGIFEEVLKQNETETETKTDKENVLNTFSKGGSNLLFQPALTLTELIEKLQGQNVLMAARQEKPKIKIEAESFKQEIKKVIFRSQSRLWQLFNDKQMKIEEFRQKSLLTFDDSYINLSSSSEVSVHLGKDDTDAVQLKELIAFVRCSFGKETISNLDKEKIETALKEAEENLLPSLKVKL